jgi:nucleoside-diphosphate-sugar epimerase|tara:strand:- start:4124 stop:5041 length:918 start_codon:yes stop_codon:yes gene_type:complete
MRILITGSNGVVGKEIVNLLSKDKKNELYLLTNKKIKKNKKKIKLFYQDLTKPINYKFKIDIIIHCAAKNPLSKSGNSSSNIYSSNIKMTRNLIKFSNNNFVKKIIFLSAMDVYGLISNRVLHENQKPSNPNLYGKSKSLSEQLFCERKNRFKTICLRIPGAFTSDLTRNRPLIITLLKKISNNENVYAYNLNKKFNNIIDAYEITKFIKLILRKKIQSKIYNFSASKPIKFIEVIKLMKKIFKSKSSIIKKNSGKNSFIISNKKIRNDLGIKISTTKKIITRGCKNILLKSSIQSKILIRDVKA